MLKYKKYVKMLSLLLVSIFGGAYLYVYIYAKSYPIPLFHRISLDAKMKFVRDMSDSDKNQVDTIIVGSSIGLNNIQGAVLEDASEKVKHVLNLSALGLKTTQVEQLTKLFSLFPNTKRVIYSSQFEDWSGAFVFEDNEVDFAKKYTLLGKNQIDQTYAFYTFKHLIEFAKNHWKWKKKYANNNTNHGLLFDHTGSVPLDMFGENINHKMFVTPPVDTRLFKEDDHALEKMIEDLQTKNIKFYFVAEPYRQFMLDKYDDVRNARKNYIQKTEEITTKYSGKFIDLHKKLHLGDEYFADREHLNSNGSVLTAKEVGAFIDTSE